MERDMTVQLDPYAASAHRTFCPIPRSLPMAQGRFHARASCPKLRLVSPRAMRDAGLFLTMAADTVPTTQAERDARALHGATPGEGGHRIDPAEIAIGVIIGRTSEFFDFFVYAIASDQEM